MGFWGEGLYDNDTASDVKDMFEELFDKEEEQNNLTETMISKNQDLINDSDEAPLFWMALADQQWNKGILEKNVKEKALFYIEKLYSDFRSGICVGKSSLIALRKKLLSVQPIIKKSRKESKAYICQWALGDTYAYPLDCVLVDGFDCKDKYLIFHKVGEKSWYPNHIIPIVWVKLADRDSLPLTIEDFDRLEYIQISVTTYENRFFPFDGSRSIEEQIKEKSKIEYKRDEFGHLPEYRAALVNTSKRTIPKNIMFLGNFQGATPPPNEHVPHEISTSTFLWKNLANNIIKSYCAFNLRQSPLYNRK